MNKPFKNSQGGFVGTLDVIIMLSVLGLVWTLWAMVERQKYDYTRAEVAGNEIAQYVASVRAFTARNRYGGLTLVEYLRNNGHTTPGTGVVFNGTNWLKMNNAAPSAGTVGCVNGLQGSGLFTDANAFLDCTFPDRTRLNQTFSTVVWWEVSPTPTFPGEGRVQSRTTIPPATFAGEVRMDLTSRALNRAASSAYGSATSDVTSATYELNGNNIVALTGFTSASSVWLEIAGTNEMTGPLNMGGNLLRDATRGHFSNSLRVGGAVGQFDADVSAGLISTEFEVIGSAQISADLTVANNATIGGEAEVESEIRSMAGDIRALTGDIRAEAGAVFVGTRLFLRSGGGAGVENNVGLDGLSANELYVDFPNAPSQRGLLAVKGDIYATDINRYSSQAVYDVTIAANNDLIQKPTCPVGKNPQVFLGVANANRATGGSEIVPVAGVSTYARSVSATQWRVFIELLDEDGLHGGESNPGGLPFPQGALFVATKCT